MYNERKIFSDGHRYAILKFVYDIGSNLALILLKLGSGCGSVGRAVASNTRGPRFESSHRQKFIYILNICLLSTVYWKDENKEKEAENGPFFKK